MTTMITGSQINWQRCQVLVTGGASFIGSHLVERLIQKGASVRVADNLSSGRLENLDAVQSKIEFLKGDLLEPDFAIKSSQGCKVVFHLAADHGGRGYIASHPANCVNNMALDNTVFRSAVANGVERITFASSACVYPTDIQTGKVLLREDMVSFTQRGGMFADEEYGWAKLMGELSLRAYRKQHGIKAAAVRIFTAYGPRENETHAIMALIAKAFIEQSPFEIWGDGTQTRNFTYVDDVVNALVLACESIEDGSAVNAGISDFISLNDAAAEVFDIMRWTPPMGIKHQLANPVGVLHRAADGTFARETTGWQPQHTFREGLERTIEWYVATHQAAQVKAYLDALLWSRNQ